MIAINFEDCNGCGECVDICPTGAIILQNGVAVLDEAVCTNCHACVDLCPQGAIVYRESVPAEGEIIRISEPLSRDMAPVESDAVSARSLVLPAVGSFLLWMGREVLPRVADIALGYLDQRVQSSNLNDSYMSVQGRDQPPKTRRRCRRVRQRQRRGKRFR